jgi:hypothetical protein
MGFNVPEYGKQLLKNAQSGISGAFWKKHKTLSRRGFQAVRANGTVLCPEGITFLKGITFKRIHLINIPNEKNYDYRRRCLLGIMRRSTNG